MDLKKTKRMFIFGKSNPKYFWTTIKIARKPSC